MSASDRALGREGRRLLLVDLENVGGGSLRTPAMAAWATRVVTEALAVVAGEQVIVGVSSIDGLFHARRSWPHARVVLGWGRDGADHALLEVLHNERVAERFGRVTIVSGDGIFADTAAALGHQGVAVTGAGWREGMSARLRLSVQRTVLLDDRFVGELAVAA